MNFVHHEFDLAADDVVEVTLDGQANVRLMDDANYALYRDGKRHTYHGGFAISSPTTLSAPRAGHWHFIVDLGGFPGQVSAAVRVLQGA